MAVSERVQTEIIDPERLYIASLEPWDRTAYRDMRDTELDFLDRCRKYGCDVHELRSTGRPALVIVPPSVKKLPRIPKKPYKIYDSILKQRAKEQLKADTIGNRTATPPHFLSHQRVSKIDVRDRIAARGSYITPEDAISLVEHNLQRKQEAISVSEKKRMKTRAEQQRERYSEMYAEYESMCKKIRDNSSRQMSVQRISGIGTQLTGFFEDGSSVHWTIPTVGIVYGTEDVVVDYPERKKRQNNQFETLIFENLNIKLMIRR